MIVQFIDEMKTVLDNILALKSQMTGGPATAQQGEDMGGEHPQMSKKSADSMTVTGTTAADSELSGAKPNAFATTSANKLKPKPK